MENNKGKILWKGNKQSGITLVALGVTIVVLLILAGVSIRLVLDNNGIITRAGEASSRSKEESAKEKVELMLSDYYMESLGGEKDLVSFLEDQEGVDSVTDNGDGTITVETDGYDVVIDTSKLEITNCEKSGGVRPEAEYAIYQTTGDATVDGTTYTEVVVTVKVTNKSALGSVDEIKMIDSKGNEITKVDTIIGDNTADASFKVSKNGKFTVTIKGTTDGIQKTENMIISIRGKIAVANMPQYWTEVSSNNNSWYNYGNQTVNTPKLIGEMIAIEYTGETDSTTPNKWANMMTSDGSMFVWIPRYAYKITSGYHSNTTGTIEVKFVDINNQFLDGTAGTAETDPGQITYTDGVQNEWLVHPAFTSNAAIGGGFDNGSGKGVTGLWVGKFETTGTADNPTVKPGVTTLKSQTINEQYKTGKSATFGESVVINSHMAKNSEWGAVAYLAHSQYGTNGKKVAQNTQNYTTSGGTKTVSTIYTDYANNSTTHNAYGIYDLNGGAWERVASYVNNGGNNLSTNGGINEGDLYGATDEERTRSTAYKTVYSGIGTQTTDYATNAEGRGDAVYEISNSASSDSGSWFSACSYFPSLNNPFFVRGGNYNSSNDSTFRFDGNDGVAYSNYGFRVCLAF